MNGGSLGVEQGFPDQQDADSGQENRRGSGYEHPKSPTRHFFLGAQIGLIAGSILLSCYFIFLGYQRANRGFDALDCGQKLRGAFLFWTGILFACGSPMLLLAVGFWLAVGDRSYLLDILS
jgi:hypothetical protein